MTEIVDGIPQPVVLTQADIDVIGEIYVKATFFAVIGSGTTSGTIPKPAGGGADVSFVMDEWGTATDALVTTMDGGKPTFQSPVNAGGSIITTTFDTAGNYSFSDTPVPAATHAVVYVYKCFLKNFNADESIFETEIGAGGDHGLLIGLGDDDHTQYLNAARAAIWFGLQDLADLGVKNHDDLDLLVAPADDHTQYALLAGRSGGQTLRGGTASGENLNLLSTAHATKGRTIVGPGGAGDSIIEFNVNDALAMMLGIDDSDSDAFKISGPAGFGSEDYVRIVPDNDMLIDVSAGGTPADLLVECGVEKTIELQTTVWDDLRVPGQNTKLNPANSEPAFTAWKNGLFLPRFLPGNDADWSVHFVAQLPHTYKQGTDIYPHVHWVPDNTNTDNVLWELEYSWANIGAVFPVATAITVLDAGSGNIDDHLVAPFAAIGGTGKLVSSVLVCRLTRLGDDGTDTYTGNAFFLEIDFHHEVNTHGSRQEYVK